jgi:hypothetical protein
MKRQFLVAVAVVVLCGGCVTAPLERYTLNQSLSTTEMRYQEVLNALAMVAHNRGNLPSYSLTSGGVANVTATVSLEATTTWNRALNGFAQQVLTLAGKHTPELQWTLDPVADPTLLTGAWYACVWAIDGPLPEGTPGYELLRKPTITDMVGYGATRQYHLGIVDDQHTIPCGWLCVGPRHCVPHGACYTAHCGDTYVSVMPGHLQDLSEFTLVLLDIATIAPTWLAQQKQQAVATVELTLPGSSDGKSTITETWSASQVPMADGSTKIVVTPFAEPSGGTHVIEKSTLSLYVPPMGTQLQPGTKVQAPARTNTPQSTPAASAPPTSHRYGG